MGLGPGKCSRIRSQNCRREKKKDTRTGTGAPHTSKRQKNQTPIPKFQFKWPDNSSNLNLDFIYEQYNK